MVERVLRVLRVVVEFGEFGGFGEFEEFGEFGEFEEFGGFEREEFEGFGGFEEFGEFEGFGEFGGFEGEGFEGEGFEGDEKAVKVVEALKEVVEVKKGVKTWELFVEAVKMSLVFVSYFFLCYYLTVCVMILVLEWAVVNSWVVNALGFLFFYFVLFCYLLAAWEVSLKLLHTMRVEVLVWMRFVAF